MSDDNRYGFTVYSDSYDGAEKLRNMIITLLQNEQRMGPDRVPQWDVDSDVTDYGPEEDDDEQPT